MTAPMPILLLLAAALLSQAPAAESQDVDRAKVAAVKSAFLLNFTKFTEWPQDAFENENDPIVIGILGDDPFGSVLDQTVEDKTVGGRSIRIRRFKDTDALPDGDRLAECHVLFVSDSLKSKVDDVIERVDGRSVLTVSDIDGFASDGGMIELELKDGKIGFRIDSAAAERAGLRLSSKLLALATIVKDD